MAAGKTGGGKGLKSAGLLISAFFIFFLLAGIGFSPTGLDTARAAEHGEAVEGHGAEEAGAAHGGHEDSGALMDLLARFINFALLVIILALVLKKSNAFGFFSDRVEDIKKKMDRLQSERDEAEARYKEIEAKLKDFESEKREILESARRDGETEKEKIIEEAQHRVAQMMAQVEVTIEQEIKDAKVRLKSEVADLAAQKARDIITREMNEDDQDRLVNEFIERVGKTH